MSELVEIVFVGGPMDGEIMSAPIDPVTRRPPPRWAGADYRKQDPKGRASAADLEIAHYVYDIGPSPILEGPFWRATHIPGARATLPPRPTRS